jgi:hypothetical protein
MHHHRSSKFEVVGGRQRRTYDTWLLLYTTHKNDTIKKLRGNGSKLLYFSIAKKENRQIIKRADVAICLSHLIRCQSVHAHSCCRSLLLSYNQATTESQI